MKPGEIRSGMVVQHAETGALGIVVRGGYRPRIRWTLNGRIVRTDEDLLRFAYEDEWSMNRALNAREAPAPDGRYRQTLTFELAEPVTPDHLAHRVALACARGALRPGEGVVRPSDGRLFQVTDAPTELPEFLRTGTRLGVANTPPGTLDIPPTESE